MAKKKDSIERIFNEHVQTDGMKQRAGEIRRQAKKLAYLIDKSCPESREKSIAMTSLDSCAINARAAIYREGEVA
jgi:hypothetical protein